MGSDKKRCSAKEGSILGIRDGLRKLAGILRSPVRAG